MSDRGRHVACAEKPELVIHLTDQTVRCGPEAAGSGMSDSTVKIKAHCQLPPTMNPTSLPVHDVDDGHLMRNLAQRKPGALVTLHQRYRSLLLHAALQIVHDEADAEEIVQDVFVQLWTRPEVYCADKGKPVSWLLTLSRRRAIDCVRRRAALRRATERLEIRERAAENEAFGAAGRELCDGDLRSYLVGIMAQLPPAQQCVVEQGFFRQKSQRQIAAELQLPLGTIKTRMELGLRKLARILEPCRELVE